jgi:hypothetical protein
MGIVKEIVSGLAGGVARGAAAATPTGAVSAVADLANTVVKRIWEDPETRAKAELEIRQLEQTGELAMLASETGLLQAQSKVNEIEAASESLFKSGWRPATGWICATGLGYQFLFCPVIGWAAQQAFGWQLPPSLQQDTLMTLLFGMLGLGAYRWREKVAGVA